MGKKEWFEDVEYNFKYSYHISQGSAPYDQISNFTKLIKNQNILLQGLKLLLKSKEND